MRFRPPATILLRRAQLTLMLATLVPTILMSVLGIVLLAAGSSRAILIVAGVCVLALSSSAITGYILGSIWVARGASIARVQSDFLSSVSHEIRTPLTSTKLFIETLREGRVTDPAEQRQCLDTMQKELDRLDGLVGRLIDLVRIEGGRHAFERRPVAIEHVVEEAVDGFRAAALGKDVDLVVDVEKGLEVLGDRAALAQALVNLLTNAWKYGEGRITLEARGDGKSVVLAVSDEGPGVALEDEKRIFREFERGQSAEGKGQGSGLGLAIVRGIARAHRGKVTVDARVPRGACFSIHLKRHQA